MKVEGSTLAEAIRRLLAHCGLSALHANDVATALVETSFDGIDTHGVRLLTTYLLELEGGRAVAAPALKVHGTRSATCVLDAGNALGAVAMSEAMRIASKRASTHGIAAIAVANSNHFGAAGYYARLAVAHGQIGLIFSNSDALVVPHGGLTPLNGTNPLAIAAPGTDGEDFVFDMATSHSAFSMVSRALDDGLDVDARALQGGRMSVSPECTVPILQPLGGIKGQGLAMAVQILCALLADMPYDAELSHLYAAPYDKPRKIAHFAIVVDVDSFVSLPAFQTRLAALHQRFRTSSPAENSSVRVPGDRERESRAKRKKEGIPIEPEIQELLRPWLLANAARHEKLTPTE